MLQVKELVKIFLSCAIWHIFKACVKSINPGIKANLSRKVTTVIFTFGLFYLLLTFSCCCSLQISWVSLSG